ncbi:26S proteasome regulatory subunit [Coelomomyces lativittatus]|nr:26S proteasome regulatory subunit [Coelomomyces lativittatus]
MNIDITPLEYLKLARSQAQKENRADLVDCFNQFEDLYEKKLWHQLSLQIDHFLTLLNIDHYLVPLYQNFVRDFEKKLNKLNLVAGIGVAVSRQLPDNHARIAFLTTLADLVSSPSSLEKHPENDEVDLEAVSATVLAKTYAAQYQLREHQLEKVMNHIHQSEQTLDRNEGLDVRVTSAFYRMAAEYYQAIGAYAKFYKTSLLFLGTLGVPLILDPKEALERAHDLSLAALVSDEIYQFGELLIHPILDALKSSPLEWLGHLLVAFNVGDLAAFETLSSHFSKEVRFGSLGFFFSFLFLIKGDF